MTLLADRQGFTDWLQGLFPQPDVTSDPKGHRIWQINDRSLKAFILQHVSRADDKGVLKRLYALVGLTLSAARGLEQENDSLGCLVAAPGVPETSEEEFALCVQEPITDDIVLMMRQPTLFLRTRSMYRRNVVRTWIMQRTTLCYRHVQRQESTA